MLFVFANLQLNFINGYLSEPDMNVKDQLSSDVMNRRLPGRKYLPGGIQGRSL